MHRVLSGIQPTGAAHLGNYFGALRHWVGEQHRAESFYCIVDLHALTVAQDPAELRRATLDLATLLLAVGLDPDACTLFVQSHVPAHSQLTWLLECTASMGELRRMTQFKDKASHGEEESARVGLFTYPVLMAADILLYRATHVPVGDDQRQHLELTRNLAERWNRRYGTVFVVPHAGVPPVAARVMDLQDPTAKMSKSGPSATGVVALADPPEVVRRKVARAVTDSDGEVRYDPAAKPGLSNLLELLAAATGERPATVAERYDRYGPLKADLADALVELLAPIQARIAELGADPGAVAAVLAKGAAKAGEVAGATYDRARRSIGLLGG